MKIRIRFFVITMILIGSCEISGAQGFLHASGKYIVNGSGQEVILKGIGTGNWMLQEGYMMKTADFAGTQHAIRQKMIETFGVENTDAFYQAWLDHQFTRADVDSMKAWGFNCVRVAMHYKLFTLPIDEEPVSGQDTWLQEGFVRIDSLLSWCSDNQMYLILDLHGAPGGQGHDANISDYDDSKPSLWESAENRRKTVALWARLAERYAAEPWIGGYDLINEPNWELPGGTLLKQLYLDITSAIREVDPNHLIFIEGNWFANDYTGLTPPWDPNMAYSFHKYWNYNTPESLDWVKSLRNSYTVPIWLGESGENSNCWFTDLIALCESNHIGWSFWPVKKDGINNVLQVTAGNNYNNLISYWKTGSPAMTAEQAFAAALEWAFDQDIANCEVKHDVIDAMIRQPHSDETLPFRIYRAGQTVPAVHYDLGKCSSAYRDADTANYHLNTNVYVNWNQGWSFRNDGVDIEASTDVYNGAPGYSIGWITDGEWLEYTLQADTTAAYTVVISTACAGTPGKFHLSVDGTDVSSPESLPATGGWQQWNTSGLNEVIFPAGTHKVRVYFDKGGSNFSYLRFQNPIPADSVPFRFVSAQTSVDGNSIILTLNKDITASEVVPADFHLTVDGENYAIGSVVSGDPGSRYVTLGLTPPVRYQQALLLSYSGTGILSGNQVLQQFSQAEVRNNLPVRYSVPAKIQAESYTYNNGFQQEDCSDSGGGLDMGYVNPGDYLDYLIYVPAAGEYTMNLRYATQSATGRADIRVSSGNAFTTVGSVSFQSTGGWQSWQNAELSISLPQGSQTLRIYAVAGEFNLNWFELAVPGAIRRMGFQGSLRIFPNPVHGVLSIGADLPRPEIVNIQVINLMGEEMIGKTIAGEQQVETTINTESLSMGIYLLRVSTPSGSAAIRFQVF